eukprot:15094683-Alexandrium_andersonii.AAC.1
MPLARAAKGAEAGHHRTGPGMSIAMCHVSSSGPPQQQYQQGSEADSKLWQKAPARLSSCMPLSARGEVMGGWHTELGCKLLPLLPMGPYELVPFQSSVIAVCSEPEQPREQMRSEPAGHKT